MTVVFAMPLVLTGSGMTEVLKAIGGGSRPKFWFYMFLVANLVYFHPLFTEFENFDRLAHN